MANPTPKNKSTRLQLPVGVAGTEPAVAPEGALAYATDTEVVRVKTSTGWEDVGGGGGGSVTSIDSPDGSIDVTNPGGPTVSVEVDPANVDASGQAHGPLSATVVSGITETGGPTALTIGAINNFQLLQRVGATVVGTAYPATTLVGDVNGPIIANEVNAIHETSGPTQLTIGAISSGQVLIRSGATVIGTSTSAPTGNPYVDPPVTADPFDDEFDTGSPDLVTRGWTIKSTGGTTLTRSGDVNPNSSTGPGANTYWSTLMGSRLFVMIPYNSAAYIYKSIPAISANDCFFARFSTQGRRTDTTSDRFSDMVSLNYSTGGNVDPANRLYVYTATTGSAFSFKTQYGRTAAGADGNALITSGVSTIGDIRGIRNVGANNWAPFTLDSTNGKMEAPYAYTGLTTASVVLFALTVDATNQSTVGNWVPYMWAIDFARRTAGTGTAFVAQTPRPVAWNVVNADITNYSSKATPVAADQVYIADSAASNAIKRATLATAVTGTFAKGLVYRNAALNSHNTSVFAKVALDTVSFDTAGIWNAANTRFIPNQPGYYLVSVRLRRATSGLFAAGIGKNGSPFQAVGGDIGTADVGLAAGGSEIVFCNGTTDYIEAFAFSANTIAYSAVGNIFDNWMSIVGPF